MDTTDIHSLSNIYCHVLSIHQSMLIMQSLLFGMLVSLLRRMPLHSLYQSRNTRANPSSFSHSNANQSLGKWTHTLPHIQTSCRALDNPPNVSHNHHNLTGSNWRWIGTCHANRWQIRCQSHVNRRTKAALNQGTSQL